MKGRYADISVGSTRRFSGAEAGPSAGVHPKIAQERLGHTTITTKLDLYSHVSQTMQEDAAERIDAAYRQARSGR
jgi:integrase